MQILLPEGSPSAKPNGFGLGLCPKNPQGTRPLTHLWALPTPVLNGSRERSFAPFPHTRIIREPYVKGLSRHILDRKGRGLRYSTVPLTTVPLHIIRLSGSANAESSADQERSAAAIFRAYYQLHGAVRPH